MRFADWKFERKMRKQRAKRKYSDDMCWSIDYTLLEILPKMIETMRKQKHGYPDGIQFEEVETFPCNWVENSIKQIEKDFSKDDYEVDIQDPFTRWHLILMRICYCLQQADENQTEIENKYEYEYHKQLWRNVKDRTNLDEVFVPASYDKNGEVLTYKMNTAKVNEELEKNWLEESREIDMYRDNMKTEAFNLINKYFWDLWD